MPLGSRDEKRLGDRQEVLGLGKLQTSLLVARAADRTRRGAASVSPGPGNHRPLPRAGIVGHFGRKTLSSPKTGIQRRRRSSRFRVASSNEHDAEHGWSAFMARALASTARADELQNDLAAAPWRAVLGQVDALPVSELQGPRPAPEHAGTLRSAWPSSMRRHVVGLLAAHGSQLVVDRPAPGASSAVARSAHTSGSAFSWMTREAEVWRR